MHRLRPSPFLGEIISIAIEFLLICTRFYLFFIVCSSSAHMGQGRYILRLSLEVTIGPSNITDLYICQVSADMRPGFMTVLKSVLSCVSRSTMENWRPLYIGRLVFSFDKSYKYGQFLDALIKYAFVWDQNESFP